MFETIKDTREYDEQIRKVRKWLDENHSPKTVSSIEDMEQVFDEGMQAFSFLKEFQKLADSKNEVIQKILEMNKDMERVLAELKTLLSDNNRNKDGKFKDSLKKIFEQLRTEIYNFYTLAITLKNQDLTHEEREIEDKWRRELKNVIFISLN